MRFLAGRFRCEPGKDCDDEKEALKKKAKEVLKGKAKELESQAKGVETSIESSKYFGWILSYWCIDLIEKEEVSEAKSAIGPVHLKPEKEEELKKTATAATAKAVGRQNSLSEFVIIVPLLGSFCGNSNGWCRQGRTCCIGKKKRCCKNSRRIVGGYG